MTSPQIFVVDDDEDDQFLLRQVLEQHLPQATIQVLEDGEEFLAALHQQATRPALVLLDLNMPRMGGLEALQQLRAASHYEEIPIVILTTSDEERDRQRARSLGVADYQVKPRSLEQMNRLILQLKQRWFSGS